MRKPKYDEATRTAIIVAALATRKENKPWSDTLAAAKNAGYKGTLGGIKQFLFVKKAEATDAAESVAPPAASAPSPAPTAKRGRKKGSKNKVKVKAKATKPVAASGKSDIETLVEKLVSERVNEAITAAIAALKSAQS